MGYKWEAQNIVSINPLDFVVDGDTVTGLNVNAEVNYGEFGMSHTIDLWPYLTQRERQRTQAIYNAIKNKVEGIILE